MDVGTISLAIPALLILLLLAGIPLAFATGMTAAIAAVVLFGPNSLLLIVSRIFDLTTNYSLLSVPMFVLMGFILERSGVAEALYRALHIWTARIPGGLAVATILAGTVMAAMVGVVGAEVVTLGLIALPAMLRRGYNKSISLGVICAAGSLGTMIPPSIVLIVYGLVANVSISALFTAAVLPGLLLSALYISYIVVRCTITPELAPPALEEDRNLPLVEKLRLGKGLVLPVLIIIGVLGSLYLGIATPTEGASIGVVGAIIASLVNRKFSLSSLADSVRQTGTTIGSVVWIFFGANALVSVYSLSGGVAYLESIITGLPLPPVGIIGVMVLILFVLGTFIDWIGIAFLTMPIFTKAIVALGYDPIWFGIVFCMSMQISYLSPPFGPACFYLKSVAPPHISLGDIFRSIWPFIILLWIGLIIVVLYPDIALWLGRWSAKI